MAKFSTDISSYHWVLAADGPLDHPLTMTLARPITPADALALLVPNPVFGPAPAAGVRDWVASSGTPSTHLVEAGWLGDWTLITEPYGWRATRMVGELSVGGRAVSVYNDTAGQSRLIVGDDGEVVRDLEGAYVWQNTEPPLVEEGDIDWGTPESGPPTDPLVLFYLLAERLTGQPLRLEWLHDPTGRQAVAVAP